MKNQKLTMTNTPTVKSIFFKTPNTDYKIILLALSFFKAKKICLFVSTDNFYMLDVRRYHNIKNFTFVKTIENESH